MSRPDLSRRAYLVEEMERPDCCGDRLVRTLAQFATLNRMIARYRCLLSRHVLADLRREPGRPRHLADLGAGGCDIDRWLVRQARRIGATLRISAIEQDERVIRYAATANQGYPEIRLVQADLFDAGIWEGADYVFANHVFHHLPDAACVQLLRRLDGAGLRRYVISDLVRSPWSYHAFRLCVAPLYRDSFVGIDGLSSVRRGFTIPEVRDLLHRAAPTHPVSLRRIFPGRFAITGGP